MKYLKKLVLVTVATSLIVLVAASSASATALYNGATKMGVGAELDFSLKSGTSAVLVNTEGGELDTCKISTVKGSITNAGGATSTVSSSISELTWGSCTFPTKTTVPGGQEIHWIPNTTIGTVTSNKEIAVTINTVFFGSCVYRAAAGTHVGTFTGNVIPAVMDLNPIVVKGEGSSLACPETAKLTATYVATSPENIRVESS